MKNFENEERKIGIELEYHGLSVKESADILAKLVGGNVQAKNDDVIEVDSDHGTYKIETDARFIKKLAQASKDNQESGETDYDGLLKKIISIVSEEFVPTELITPPLPISKIHDIVKIHQELAKKGAEGTIESARFAFGAQLNPELVSLEADSILSYFKSFLILSEWLKNQIQIDTSRTLTSFSADFPVNYQKKIFDKAYKPDLSQLIDDYLVDNPSRNRSLDMLPLFTYIDEKRVLNKVKDQKINSRPTFHYRLPNCQISLKSWSIAIEWQRWLIVERLANNKDLFEEMSERYLEYLNSSFEFSKADWLMDLNNYAERLRLCDL